MFNGISVERRVEDDAEDTKAEKPKKREKSLVTPKKEESSTVNVEPTAITPLQLELLTAKEDESVYATSVPRETTEHDVTSYVVVQLFQTFSNSTFSFVDLD